MSSNLETLKKIFVAGIGSALMSEDSLLKYLTELKLPRDAKNYVMTQAQKGKDELAKALSAEISRHIAKLDLQEEIRKALHGMKVHVEATLHFEKAQTTIKVTKAKTIRPASGKRTTPRKK